MTYISKAQIQQTYNTCSYYYRYFYTYVAGLFYHYKIIKIFIFTHIFYLYLATIYL